jgi:TRAP-type C4-dicarboxylate transport system permease large subunit
VIGYLGITRALTQYVTSMGLSPYMLIVILTVLYLILGCLVDGFSMIVMTAPIVLPLIEAAKFDTVWFGIYLVLMIELAQITPPVGFNLFVISGLNNDALSTVSRAAFPFFCHHAAGDGSVDGLSGYRAVPPEQDDREMIRTAI